MNQKLLNKLNMILGVDGLEPSVSPALGMSGADHVPPDSIYIDENLDVSRLDQNQLILVHVLLHQFYSNYKKDMDRTFIEELHDKIAKKIKHVHFDKLDTRMKNDG